MIHGILNIHIQAPQNTSRHGQDQQSAAIEGLVHYKITPSPIHTHEELRDRIDTHVYID